MESFLICSLTTTSSLREFKNNPLEKLFNAERLMFFLTVDLRFNPNFFLSSLTSPNPFFMAWPVVRIFIFLPFIHTSPLNDLSRPNIVFTISVRPDPIKPAMPTTSPRLIKKFMSANFAPVKPVTDNKISPASRFSAGKTEVNSLPTIKEISLSLSSSDRSRVFMYFPSRITVMVSAIFQISSILCEI